MKQDQETIDNERKSQGVASTTPAGQQRSESGNRKSEEKKKNKPGKLAHNAGQGK